MAVAIAAATLYSLWFLVRLRCHGQGYYHRNSQKGTHPMPTIGHSTGLLLIDGSSRDDDGQYSFSVSSGASEDYLGWGMSSAYPEIAENPPEGAVHTVYLNGELDDDTKRAIRDLARQHVERYGECRIYAWPENGPLAAWVSAGTPDPEDKDQNAVAERLTAEYAGKGLVNTAEPSLIASPDLPGTDREPSFVSEADSPEGLHTDDGWDTSTAPVSPAPEDVDEQVYAEKRPEEEGVPSNPPGPEAVSVNPEADAEPGQAQGENIPGEPASNPTKRKRPGAR